MTADELIDKNFETLTVEEVAYILMLTMDSGEWHTPGVSDIHIHTQTRSVIHGFFSCSKHNTFHDQERWFNINSNTVQIWTEEYVRGKANINHYRPIYNLSKLAKILDELKL